LQLERDALVKNLRAATAAADAAAADAARAHAALADVVSTRQALEALLRRREGALARERAARRRAEGGEGIAASPSRNRAGWGGQEESSDEGSGFSDIVAEVRASVEGGRIFGGGGSPSARRSGLKAAGVVGHGSGSPKRRAFVVDSDDD
jgi:hypothetical protein